MVYPLNANKECDFFLAYSIKQKSISNINVPTVGCLERPGISDYTSFSHLAQNGMWTLKKEEERDNVSGTF